MIEYKGQLNLGNEILSVYQIIGNAKYGKMSDDDTVLDKDDN